MYRTRRKHVLCTHFTYRKITVQGLCSPLELTVCTSRSKLSRERLKDCIMNLCAILFCRQGVNVQIIPASEVGPCLSHDQPLFSPSSILPSPLLPCSMVISTMVWLTTTQQEKKSSHSVKVTIQCIDVVK